MAEPAEPFIQCVARMLIGIYSLLVISILVSVWGIVESGMHTTGTGLWLWRSVMMDGGLLSKATLPIDGILGVLTCSVAAWILYEHGKYSRTA